MRRGNASLNGSQLTAWKRGGRLFIQFVMMLTSIASLLGPVPVAFAQPEAQVTPVQTLLASMSPEERVGQLFLVTFRGTNTNAESQIYDLIANHHVGGLILFAENDNFLGSPDTISSVHQLIEQLQAIELQPILATPSNETPAPTLESNAIPLFIGISQEGDGAPHDQILSGLTPLPDAMAIGATWKPELAQQVGSVLGNELSALGFNLFLGPALDVAESPNPSTQIDLGSRSFGGDPFWVGRMGEAYISGLHTGSNGRMMVVAKHFPGRGSSDRSPEQEVATVRKSLEQLKQIELSPFFDVTNSTEPTSIADGLLVSHIRYQGFQGNIRATTRPVSLDASALSMIITLPEFAGWRTNGGLIVSDALGSQAVRDFYSQGGENFSARLVARDAFLAGNDLLYLGDISSQEQELDTYSATLRILEFFTQEYISDPAFAELVDAAVTRILSQKFRMYDTFTPAVVLAPESGLMGIGTSQQVTFEVARSSATLISPDSQELSTLLPAPPNQNDRIVFLTDTAVTYQQCSACAPQSAMTADALKEVVERLYGPGGSAQIFASRLTYYPLSELGLMLSGETEENIEPSLERANWIVISLMDVGDGQIELLRRLFSERPNLIRNKNVILFSFTAPYYLDATDISKLTAYYALYSKQPAFVEVAARLLFQQITLQGASPVSTVGYDLITATSPEPSQVIPLALDEGNESLTPAPEATPQTPEPTAVPLYKIGDTISVRAGPIYDHNHHIVPDDTPVQFMMSTRDEGGQIMRQFIDAVTTDGVARAAFAIDQPGKVEINAISEPAMISQGLQLDASNEGAAVTVVVPLVTLTPIPATATATLPPESDLISRDGYPRIGVWLLVLLALFGGALLAYWAVSRIFSPRWGLRWALCIFIGGLLGYNYLALGFPRAAEWVASEGGAFGVLIITFLGEVVGILVAWTWMRLFNEPKSRAG